MKKPKELSEEQFVALLERADQCVYIQAALYRYRNGVPFVAAMSDIIVTMSKDRERLVTELTRLAASSFPLG